MKIEKSKSRNNKNLRVDSVRFGGRKNASLFFTVSEILIHPFTLEREIIYTLCFKRTARYTVEYMVRKGIHQRYKNI